VAKARCTLRKDSVLAAEYVFQCPFIALWGYDDVILLRTRYGTVLVPESANGFDHLLRWVDTRGITTRTEVE
jgi:hypothetical protein